MVTRDEEHSTRGRANALRLALGGVLPASELWSRRMGEVLELCIECKGCTAECPSGVNMTRLKSEWLAQRHARFGTPLRAQLFGHIRTINSVGSALAPLSNLALRLPGVSLLNELAFGISHHRTLPRFTSQTFTQWFKTRYSAVGEGSNIQYPKRDSQRRTVVLFPDSFTEYNDPHIGIAATHLLETLGYNVIVPSRPVCCGRPLLSKGLLHQAKRFAEQQLDWLAPYAQHNIPIVGLEPSCLLTFRDEYGDLLDDPRVDALKRALLLDEFLSQELDRGSLRIQQFNPHHHERRPVLVHGHCHQKALASTQPTMKLLAVAGWSARELDSGCCGMAGSFGYEREHYQISLKIGERVLLPAVRAAATDTTIVATGTSCRQQIADGAGRRARHIAEVLWQRLAAGRYNDGNG
jgi:Fe-S oxidoreductase